MDTLSWVIVAVFLLFCLILIATGFTKPIPPADQKKEHEKKN